MPHALPADRKISRTRNVLANWGAYIFAAGINFFLSPFVVHSLGDVSYGIWILLGSLVGYLGLLDLGVRAAVTRYVAKFHSKEDHLEATRITSSALVIFSITGCLAIAIACALAVFVANFFEIPVELITVAQVVLILSGVNIAISMISGVYGGVVVALQKFEYANMVEIVIGAVRALAVVLALNEGLGLIALAVIQLGISSLRGMASYLLSRRFYPQLRINFSDCRRSDMKMIANFSISILLLQASGMIIMFTDTVVIGAFLPLSMVTFFTIAANLKEYARAPISGISTTLTPWTSTLEAKDQIHEVGRVLLATARIATLIVLPILLTFMLRGSSFIGLWMGTEYALLSGEVLWILSLSLCFTVASQVIASIMMGISKHSGLVPAYVIEAVCNIGLSVVWVQSYGIIGVAWGTTVPRLVVSLLFIPWYVRRVLGTPISKFWVTVWIRPAIAMIPFALGSLLVHKFWLADNLIVYFAQVAAVLPLAVVGAWAVSLTPSERSRFVPSGLIGRLRNSITKTG
jgi:O-antigen/teichoic acid export membrane protein